MLISQFHFSMINGQAEIFLPPVSSKAGPVVALDHPAHILLAAMHVVGDKGGLYDGHAIYLNPDGYPGPIALASGKAEHFLPPEPVRAIAKRATSRSRKPARRARR